MIIGRVNNEAIHLDSNVVNFSPIINSAMLLPIADYKESKKIVVPYEPSPVLIMTHGYEYFCQFLGKGPTAQILNFKIDWTKNTKAPKKQVPGTTIALKMDGVMSYIAYEFLKDTLKISPYSIVYSQSQHDEIKKWFDRIGMPNIPCIIVDYTKYGDIPSLMNKYENWLAATIAANKSNTLWFAYPHTEISNYIPDRTARFYSDGGDWLSKEHGRRVMIESPFPENKTRTDIFMDALEKGLTKFDLAKAVKCRCGMCFECLMNWVAFTNIGEKPDKLFNATFKNSALVNTIKTLIDLDKLSDSLVKEISNYIDI